MDHEVSRLNDIVQRIACEIARDHRRSCVDAAAEDRRAHHRHDGNPGLSQTTDKMRSDESGGSGDDHPPGISVHRDGTGGGAWPPPSVRRRGRGRDQDVSSATRQRPPAALCRAPANAHDGESAAGRRVARVVRRKKNATAKLRTIVMLAVAKGSGAHRANCIMNRKAKNSRRWLRKYS